MTDKPRNNCRWYFEEKGILSPEKITKDEFDQHYDEERFSDGPYQETFGNGYGEPYNPYRQAYGKLKDGRYVYCELNDTGVVNDE